MPILCFTFLSWYITESLLTQINVALNWQTVADSQWYVQQMLGKSGSTVEEFSTVCGVKSWNQAFYEDKIPEKGTSPWTEASSTKYLYICLLMLLLLLHFLFIKLSFT